MRARFVAFAPSPVYPPQRLRQRDVLYIYIFLCDEKLFSNPQEDDVDDTTVVDRSAISFHPMAKHAISPFFCCSVQRHKSQRKSSIVPHSFSSHFIGEYKTPNTALEPFVINSLTIFHKHQPLVHFIFSPFGAAFVSFPFWVCEELLFICIPSSSRNFASVYQ